MTYHSLPETLHRDNLSSLGLFVRGDVDVPGLYRNMRALAPSEQRRSSIVKADCVFPVCVGVFLFLRSTSAHELCEEEGGYGCEGERESRGNIERTGLFKPW